MALNGKNVRSAFRGGTTRESRDFRFLLILERQIGRKLFDRSTHAITVGLTRQKRCANYERTDVIVPAWPGIHAINRCNMGFAVSP